MSFTEESALPGLWAPRAKSVFRGFPGWTELQGVQVQTGRLVRKDRLGRLPAQVQAQDRRGPPGGRARTACLESQGNEDPPVQMVILVRRARRARGVPTA